MPDLSQTQNICSPTSPSSSHDLELQLDSVQVFLSFGRLSNSSLDGVVK